MQDFYISKRSEYFFTTTDQSAGNIAPVKDKTNLIKEDTGHQKIIF